MTETQSAKESSKELTEKPNKEAQVSHDENAGRKTLSEDDCWELLGYSWPAWKRWYILVVMFCIQISINLNASLYADGVPAISKTYGVSEQAARVPQATFLIAYAFGCLLWAPWSEEYGRWKVQQLSLFFVNIWQIPCALAPNYATYVVCRTLGGLSIAGGSVTLGVLADLWQPENQDYAVAFLVLSSVGGSVVGAVVGGFVGAFRSLPWIFWTQFLVGVGVQVLHGLTVPETRTTLIVEKEAKRRRKNGDEVYGPDEGQRKVTWNLIGVTFYRPFHMLVTEPIIAFLSTVSGFSDNLIFIFLQGFTPVFKKWNFTSWETGLAFVSLLVGYFISYLSFLPSIRYFERKRAREGPESVPPEKRLWWLLFLIPFEFTGLLIFAFTSLGPSHGIPWIAPMIGAAMVGIANYAIYQSSIDYTISAYEEYAASATGSNDFARDLLSGIAAMYSAPMYTYIGGKSSNWAQTWASLILAIIAIFVTAPLYYFYKNGERIRKASPFAAKIAKRKEDKQKKRQKGGKAGHEHPGDP